MSCFGDTRTRFLPCMGREVLYICHPVLDFFLASLVLFQALQFGSLLLVPMLLLRTYRAHYSQLPMKLEITHSSLHQRNLHLSRQRVAVVSSSQAGSSSVSLAVVYTLFRRSEKIPLGFIPLGADKFNNVTL